MLLAAPIFYDHFQHVTRGQSKEGAKFLGTGLEQSVTIRAGVLTKVDAFLQNTFDEVLESLITLKCSFGRKHWHEISGEIDRLLN